MHGPTKDTWKVILVIVQAVVLPIVGWLANNDWDHEKRLTAIEASRFTAADGSVLRRDLDVKLGALMERVGELKVLIARLPTEVPPAWFLEEVRSLERRMSTIEKENGK